MASSDRHAPAARGRGSAHVLTVLWRVYLSPVGMLVPVVSFVAGVSVWWALALLLPWLLAHRLTGGMR